MIDREDELALKIWQGRESGEPVRTMRASTTGLRARVTDGI